MKHCISEMIPNAQIYCIPPLFVKSFKHENENGLKIYIFNQIEFWVN
jgi:hypothetical protein